MQPWPNLIYDPDIQAMIDFFRRSSVASVILRQYCKRDHDHFLPHSYKSVCTYSAIQGKWLASFMLRAL